MSTETLSPLVEFNDGFSDRAVRACLIHGGVLLRSSVSLDTVATLQSSIPTEFNRMKQKCSLIAQTHRYLTNWSGTEDDYEGNVEVGTLTTKDQTISHRDSSCPRSTVLSILVPITGESAEFYVGNAQFSIRNNKDDFLSLGLYGPGDAVLLRQSVLCLNGEQALFPQAEHIGVGPGSRTLAVVDFYRDGNKLDVPITT